MNFFLYVPLTCCNPRLVQSDSTRGLHIDPFRLELPPISQHAVPLLVSGIIAQKLTSMCLISKEVFPAIYIFFFFKYYILSCHNMQILGLTSGSPYHNGHAQSKVLSNIPTSPHTPVICSCPRHKDMSP